MHIVVVALLVVIVLVLLGALGPVLYILAAGVFALADELLIGLGIGALWAVSVIAYQAMRRDKP